MSKILRKLLKENITTDPNKIVEILEKDCSDILSIYDNTKMSYIEVVSKSFYFLKEPLAKIDDHEILIKNYMIYWTNCFISISCGLS